MENSSSLEPSLESTRPSALPESQWLQGVLDRVAGTVTRDAMVRQTTLQLQVQLKTDRVVLYYFYRHWKGQVVSEALGEAASTILGCTGADDCFNDEYAALYEAGRCRAVTDTLTEPMHECHRDFLKSIHVRANLVVPILIPKGLWGLLVAHHCHGPHTWLDPEIEQMQTVAKMLATAPCIQDS